MNRNPNMNPDDPRNIDPVYRDRYGTPAPEGSGSGTIIAVIVASFMVGGIIWALNRDNGGATTATNPAPSTVGQGAPRTMAPVIDKTTPAPAPTNETAAPAPRADTPAADTPAAPAPDAGQATPKQ